MTTQEPTAAEERARIVAWLDGRIEDLNFLLNSPSVRDSHQRFFWEEVELKKVRQAITTGKHWEKDE